MTPRKRQAPLQVVHDENTPKKALARKAPAAKRAPLKAAPKSVAEAAVSGDRRELLLALGNRVGKALDDPKTAGPALAALIKQAREISEAIAAIDQAADAAEALLGSKSIVATTPDEAWDESMI